MGNSDNYKRVEWRLHSYKGNITRLKNLEEEIEKEKNNYRSIGAVTYDERISGTNIVNSSIENEIIRREERLYRLQKEKNNLECDIRQIENVFEVLSEEEMKLIKERYFKKKTFLQLTQVFPYSMTSMYNITKKLIRKIESLLYF